MRGLFLLPWAFFLLGLLPLALLAPEGNLGEGLGFLLAALLLAGAASLFSRFPLAPRVQFALVLALALWTLDLALRAASAFVGGVSFPGYVAPILGSLALLAAFLLGTGEEAPLLPPSQGIGGPEELKRMAGALEGLALRRPLVLVYLEAPIGPERLLSELRRGDLAFRLEGGYLLVLQGSRPEDAAGLLRRLRERFPLSAQAVERWQGGSLEGVLARLKAEAILSG